MFTLFRRRRNAAARSYRGITPPPPAGAPGPTRPNAAPAWAYAPTVAVPRPGRAGWLTPAQAWRGERRPVVTPAPACRGPAADIVPVDIPDRHKYDPQASRSPVHRIPPGGGRALAQGTGHGPRDARHHGRRDANGHGGRQGQGGGCGRTAPTGAGNRPVETSAAGAAR